MIDIAMLRSMAARGASADTIIDAVELALASVQAQRKKNAERQARHRERVTLRNVTSRYVTPACVSKKEREEEEESKKERKESTHARASPLPDGWRLSEADTAYARSKNWDESRIQAEAERFSHHARLRGRAVADWSAAWRAWVTSPYQQQQPKTESGSGRGRSILDAADRLIEQLGGHEAAKRYVPGSSGPQPLNLDSRAGAARLRLVPSG